MHEYSIVQSLLDIIEENAKKHGGKKVSKVVVKIGVLSGVEPHLLQVAFDTFKANTICKDAVFEMAIQPIVVECKDCFKKSEFEKNRLFFECEYCKSVNLEILDGEDMVLLSLEME
jgi:hydrogenase nickel incorporation protein HypA/HybF